MINVDNNIKNILKLSGRDVPSDPKMLPALLKTYPLSLSKINKYVNKDGAVYVVEPLLVYNKFLRTIKLTVNPQIGDQIIKVLRFNPKQYQQVLTSGYYTTAVSMSLRDNDVNILIISKDEKHALELKNMLEKLK